jgi:hypothetical protein
MEFFFMGFFNKLFGEPTKTIMIYFCDFCGKKLHDVKVNPNMVNSYENVKDMIKKLLSLKCVCPECNSIFCFHCAKIEGNKRGTRKPTCPKCGTIVPQDQYS